VDRRASYDRGVDTPGFVAAVEAESKRCLDALRAADLATDVPSCPGWTGADLAWHLAEVQRFWADIVARLLDDPGEHEKPERPPDEALLDLLEESSSALVAALRDRSPEDRCWTWHPDGGTVAWVARRQAHEALIHRADAEQVAGLPVSEADPALAADGVDEIVTVMIDSVPPWGTFTPERDALTLLATETGRRWTLQFGRVTGTGPESGRAYDLDAARVAHEHPTDTTVSGRAWDLDLWLWGRGDDNPLAISGDESLVRRLRAIAVDATQ
jgi:uncharacterized protein (TIGR03083 family)